VHRRREIIEGLLRQISLGFRRLHTCGCPIVLSANSGIHDSLLKEIEDP
jgi:hypothetical protein